MIDKLNILSDNLELWGKAKAQALKCIETYISEAEIYNDFPELIEVKKENFIFNKNKQSLIFWQDKNKTFIIRTTYDLHLENENIKLNGYYSFDIDENYNFYDEWLVLHKINGG